MTKIQNMCWAPFLVRILDSTNSTKRDANLTFSAFTPDNNRTIIQIGNLIFLITQTLYLLLEFSSVFKCLLGEILSNKYVGAFQLSPIFRIFSLSLKFSRRQMIVLAVFFLFFFALWALSMIILFSMFSFSLKSFSTSALQSSQLSPTFFLIPSILRLFLLERSSKSTNSVWTYSGSSCHSYISRIRSSRCSAFSWHFWTFSSGKFSVNSMLFLRWFISAFMDLISFNVISRLPLTRLSKFSVVFRILL